MDSPRKLPHPCNCKHGVFPQGYHYECGSPQRLEAMKRFYFAPLPPDDDKTCPYKEPK